MIRHIIDVVPYREAHATTRRAFEEAYKNFAPLLGTPPDHLPDIWRCKQCGTELALEDLHISYRMDGIDVHWPMPVCSTSGCSGHAWNQIEPAER